MEFVKAKIKLDKTVNVFVYSQLPRNLSTVRFLYSTPNFTQLSGTLCGIYIA